jgi:hypothetical protein
MIRSRRLPLSGLWIGLIVLLGVAGFLGYRAYRASLDQAALVKALDRDAESMEAILKLESEGPPRTYQDVFALCDRSIERRTVFIFGLQSDYPSLRESLRRQLTDFLNVENELVRFKRELYRERLNLMTAKEQFTEHVATRSGRRSDRYFAKASALNEDLLKATTGVYRNATQFSLAYSRLLIIERMLGLELAGTQVTFRQIFGQHRDLNMKFLDDLKKLADVVRTSVR